MNAFIKPFVHVLLFECTQCASPIPSAVASDHRSVEHIDSRSIDVACHCGWKSSVPATDAKRHWVDCWPSAGAPLTAKNIVR